MKLWDNFRNYFYKKKLAARLRNSKEKVRTITNLSDAKSIGILFDGTNPANTIAIVRFVDSLKEWGKEVDLLAFVNDNKTENNNGIVVLNKNYVSWVRVPEGKKMEQFADKDFDLMLACYTGENLPLEYIARISQAKWRVGPYANDKMEHYDLMINVGGKTEVQYLLDQTIHFLNQIKYDEK